MVQPFRSKLLNGTFERKYSFPFVTANFHDDYILLKTDCFFECLSNAVWNGGWMRANHFFNWKVPLDFAGIEPEQLLAQQIFDWKYKPEQSLGLMTAAKLTHATFAHTKDDHFELVCCVTAGTGNAVRAGTERETFSEYKLGTVNIVVLVDARLTNGALANAMITVTEAKTAALQDAGITDGLYPKLATGTTTDAVIIGASQRGAFMVEHRYAGMATKLGNAIEKAVYQATLTAVQTQSMP